MTRSSASLRLVHSWLLLIASTAVMAGASMATHIAGSAEGGSEAAEHAQHIAAPTIIGPLGALFLLAILWVLRGRALRPGWFLALPVLAFAIQEVAERMTEAAAPEPGIVATAITQVLFGLLAFALARVVLRTARRIAQFLARQPGRPRLPIDRRAWPVPLASFAEAQPPGGAHYGRAPPAPA